MKAWMVLAAVLCVTVGAHAYEPTEESRVVYEEAQRRRAAVGLGRQEHDPGLASIAQRVANWQASRGAMGHTSLGDNFVAYGAGPVGTVSMWMNSGPHRAHLTSGHRFCGYGFARSASGTTFAAAIFRSHRAEICDPTDLSGIAGNGGGGDRGWLRWRRR